LFKYADAPCKLKSWESFGIILRLAGFIKQNKIRVVHTHTFNAHVWGSVAAKLTGARVLEHVHDSRYLDPGEFSRRGETSRQYKMIKRFRNISDRVVVLTRQNYDFVTANKINRPERTRKIFNGIPMDGACETHPESLREWRQKLSIPAEAKVVVTPIRFSPEKNTELLLKIITDVVARTRQCFFIVAGDGPLLEEFKSKIKSGGLEHNARLPGFVADMQGLLAAADIFLLPSKLELHSIAILEAMSLKLPVVVSRDVGCHEEFIEDGTNGILCDPFTGDGWAEALIRLIKDGPLRQRIGEAGFKTCRERFDIRDTARRFEALYAELVHCQASLSDSEPALA
jgi:glycosyltransferase involved in cell wall biosynthesis